LLLTWNRIGYASPKITVFPPLRLAANVSLLRWKLPATSKRFLMLSCRASVNEIALRPPHPNFDLFNNANLDRFYTILTIFQIKREPCELINIPGPAFAGDQRTEAA
jgi:hypothetical protein